MMSESENPSATSDLLARDLAAARQRIRDLEARSGVESAAETDALAASGERLRLLLGNLQELILVVDPDLRITDVAGNCMGLIGYAARELVGPGIDLNLLQLFSEGDRQAVRNQFAEAGLRPQGSSIEVRIMDRAGEDRWVECTLVPLYGEAEQQLTGLQVILRDIGERVRSEQMMHSLNRAAAAVQKASLSLDDVLEAVTGQLYALSLNSGVGLFDPDSGRVDWVKFRGDSRFMQAVDKAMRELPGVSMEHVPGARAALLAGEPAVLDLDQTIMAQKGIDLAAARQIAQLLGPTTFIVVPLLAEAHSVGYLAVAAPWLTTDNVPAIQAYANQTAIAIHNSRLIGLLADSETQYRAIFESARDGLLVMDGQGVVVAASETTCRLFGIDYAEMIGQRVDSLFTLTLEQIAAGCQEGVYGGDSATVLGQALPRQGEPIPVELRGSRITFGSQVHLMVLITDISERIRAQEALIQSERLSALGQMAGGIAHDFNNILVSILGYSQMASEDVEHHPERIPDDLAQIEAGARNAADAVSRLQSLYRDSDDRSDFVPIQLDDILMDALALNRPRWKDIPQLQGITYRIETRLERPAPVLGNASELRRVLSNLLINAIDAMPQGGLLLFESRQCGDDSCVSIRDSGAGIAPEIQQRVFEPFFTTKKSSGLGLTVSTNIVRRHNGEVKLDSEPGQGTCITLRFPGYRPEAARETGESLAARGHSVRPLSVLVIDDEPHVRTVLARVLERQGHSARAVANGQEGLAALQQEHFDLLICDLGMPEMPGSVVMQRAHALAPQMPIILSTGWGDTITPDQLKQMSARALLPKPFGQEDVRRAVAEAIDAGLGNHPGSD